MKGFVIILISTEAMTRHLAVEWGPDKVRVMCVAPGPIGDTEGMNRLGNSSCDNNLLYVSVLKEIFTLYTIIRLC